MTRKDLEEIIKETFSQKPPVGITIHTGLEGYYNFNFVMSGLEGHIKTRHWRQKLGRRTKGLFQINLIQKHGLLKVIVDMKKKSFRLSFRVGTVEVAQSDNFSDVDKFVEKYKDIL